MASGSIVNESARGEVSIWDDGAQHEVPSQPELASLTKSIWPAYGSRRSVSATGWQTAMRWPREKDWPSSFCTDFQGPRYTASVAFEPSQSSQQFGGSL